MTSATTGNGTLTLGTAIPGLLTFADAGLVNNDVISYSIIDGVNTEVGIGTYTAAGTTLSRDTVLNSTNSGNKISCSGSQKVYVTFLASDIVAFEDINRFGFNNRTETTISFDGTDTFTLGSVGASWSYWRSGTKNTITGNKTVKVATPMVDVTMYYIYIDG